MLLVCIKVKCGQWCFAGGGHLVREFDVETADMSGGN